MKLKYLKFIFLLAMGSSLLVSCRKDEDSEFNGDGPTYVKLQEAPERKLFFTPFSETRKVNLFSIRRDAATNADLQKAFTLNLTKNTTLLDDYNTDNNDNYEWLPDSLYTLNNGAITPDGNGYKVVFNGGDFAQEFDIMLNGAKWDLSKKYAVAFTIADPAGFKFPAGKSEILVLISIKNKYDGVYEITGTLTDANGLYHGDYGDPDYPRIYSMTTVTTNQVLFYDVSWDYPNYIVLRNTDNAGANTGIRPLLTMDLATDEVVSIVNANNGQALTVGAGSKFNASNRSWQVEWTLGRWHAVETWTFLRER